MVPNQGLQGIAFFEATACLTLLVLFVHLRRDNRASFYRFWLLGWICLTLSSFSELALLFAPSSLLRVVASGAGVAALMLFLTAIVEFTLGNNRMQWPVLWLSMLFALTASYYESKVTRFGEVRWETAILESAICLVTGWLLWRDSRASEGHGAKLLAGAFTLLGLNGFDRPT